jgi:hypothetical protein
VSVLDKVRRWIDGETSETVLEEAARDAQVKPRSPAEEFIVKIARAVEQVMQNEMVPLPQGTTIIPCEYIIFLSNEDDKEWQGAKRRGLEQGLYHILAERAKEIAGRKKLETKSFVVELRVDGTLEKGDIRVQHTWEDTSSSKTSVLARPKALEQSAVNQTPTPLPKTQSQVNFPPSPNFSSNQPTHFNEPLPTVPQIAPNYTGAQPGVSSEEGEEMTRVKKRIQELYRLEIWRGGVRQNVVPIFHNEIVIGRGSRSKPVDITLAGDPEISSRHLILVCDAAGNFSLINEGRNPAVINDKELPIGQKISISPGIPIGICSYVLRIQPRGM